MGGNRAGRGEVGQRDPVFTERLVGILHPLMKRYFRAEVRGLDGMPPGSALLVGNHSGGMFTMDVPILASAIYRRFGYRRPVYTLAHYGVFLGNVGNWLRRAGVSGASRANAAAALRGNRLARLIGLDRVRMKILPLTFGLPFGLTTVLPANLPLPSKVGTEMLDSIDIPTRFGVDPDVGEVDAYVRAVMQRALDRLAAERRFPVLG